MATNANKPGDNHDPHIGQPKLAPILEHVYGDENDENTNKITVNEAEREIRNIIQVDTTETNVDAIVKEKRRQSVDLFRKMLSEFRGNMIFPQANRKFSTDIVKLSDEDEKPRKDTKTGDKGAETYSVLCKRYKKVPINTVMRQFGKEVINLDGFDLSSKELKAFFVALLDSYVNKEDEEQNEDVDEKSIELSQLELGGNKMGVREINYLGDFVTSYPPLVSILLNRCRMCTHTMQQLASVVRTNKTLRRLDLSENNLTDKDSTFIADIIEHNEQLKELVLRKNNLGDSGTRIGEALVSNDTLTCLDLSWNHIRANGAIGICKGIRHNKGLETLILAWNGFGWEGSAAMGWALLENTTLQSLDLTCNRIHPPALFELLKGLEKNKALTTLKLSHNPITAPMTTIMMTRFLKAKESNLKELDLEGIVVDKEFDEVLKQIQEHRLFFVRYEAALPLVKTQVSQVDSKNIYNIDPIRILYFMKEHLRTIDLFLKFDKDCSNFLTRDEMKYAFEMEGFPISSTALDQVMGYLDINKDGEIDLLEFIEGERKLKRQLIQEREDAAAAEKAKDNKFSKTYTPNANQTPRSESNDPKQVPKQRRLPPLKNPKTAMNS